MARRMKNPLKRDEADLGKLYRAIKVERSALGDEEKLERAKDPPFVSFCKRIRGNKPRDRKKRFKEKHQQAIDFLGWDLHPDELNAAVMLVFAASMVLFVALAIGALFTLGPLLAEILGDETMVAVYLFLPAIAVPLFLTYYVQNYPLEAAHTEQVRALTHVPEIMGYMIMSMKLVPNLEKAVEFAATHGRGKVAHDFQRLLWDLQLGVYKTLSEGLDKMAIRWGKFSQEFKESLMSVRAAVLEDTETKRYEMLDKTMENLLESVKLKMEGYARGLTQPSTGLFYLGVLLPLILIIILPVGSAFSGQAFARPEVLVFIYNIALPAAALVFAYMILRTRPPTYQPPVIPDNYPGIPPKGTARLGGANVSIVALMALIMVAGVGASYYLHAYGVGIPDADARYGTSCILSVSESEDICMLQDRPASFVLAQAGGFTEDHFSVDPPGAVMRAKLIANGGDAEAAAVATRAEEYQFYLDARNDTTPNTLLFGALLSFSLVIFAYLYFNNVYKRRVQKKIGVMESEFKEALYILASRMGENRPVEDALKHIRDFLPTYTVSEKVFARTLHNIEVLGMPLEKAVFDKTYGSLRDVPSPTIRSSMKLVVDSVKLGVDVAARTLVSLSLQLANREKVSQLLRSLVSEVTSMMRMMSVFIAPAILGVTTALQRIVMVTLANTASGSQAGLSQASSAAGASGFGALGSFTITAETLHVLATPPQFLFIVALYVIEIVLILRWFASKVEEDNDTAARVDMGIAVPIAIVIFLAATIVSGMVVGTVYG